MPSATTVTETVTDIPGLINSKKSGIDPASSMNGEAPVIDSAISINGQSEAMDLQQSINGEGSVSEPAHSTNGQIQAVNPAHSINGHGPSVDAAHPVNGNGPAAEPAHPASGEDFTMCTAASTNGFGSAIDKTSSVDIDGASYWWRTSGQDLSRMLQEANCMEECQRQFLDFYRDTLCPLLGNKPKSGSLPAAVGWDGNPFEYSFEFKGSTKKPGVRFVLDLSELRPSDKDYPLSVENVENVLEVLAKRSPMFDDTWVRMTIEHQAPTLLVILFPYSFQSVHQLIGFVSSLSFLD